MFLLCYLFKKKIIDRHLQYEERHNKHLSCQSIEQIKRLIIFNPKNKERKKLTSKWSHTNPHSRSRDETLPSGLKFPPKWIEIPVWRFPKAIPTHTSVSIYFKNQSIDLYSLLTCT